MPQVGRGKLCPTIPQRHADSSKMQTYFPNSVIPTPSGLVNEKTVEIRDNTELKMFLKRERSGFSMYMMYMMY